MCCVPNCKGNYRSGPKVSVFSFPNNNEEKARWLHAIKRDQYVPNKNSRLSAIFIFVIFLSALYFFKVLFVTE